MLCEKQSCDLESASDYQPPWRHTRIWAHERLWKVSQWKNRFVQPPISPNHLIMEPVVSCTILVVFHVTRFGKHCPRMFSIHCHEEMSDPTWRQVRAPPQAWNSQYWVLQVSCNLVIPQRWQRLCSMDGSKPSYLPTAKRAHWANSWCFLKQMMWSPFSTMCRAPWKDGEIWDQADLGLNTSSTPDLLCGLG